MLNIIKHEVMRLKNEEPKIAALMDIYIMTSKSNIFLVLAML